MRVFGRRFFEHPVQERLDRPSDFDRPVAQQEVFAAAQSALRHLSTDKREPEPGELLPRGEDVRYKKHEPSAAELLAEVGDALGRLGNRYGDQFTLRDLTQTSTRELAPEGGEAARRVMDRVGIVQSFLVARFNAEQQRQPARFGRHSADMQRPFDAGVIAELWRESASQVLWDTGLRNQTPKEARRISAEPREWEEVADTLQTLARAHGKQVITASELDHMVGEMGQVVAMLEAAQRGRTAPGMRTSYLGRAADEASAAHHLVEFLERCAAGGQLRKYAEASSSAADEGLRIPPG